jgi:PAS domain S-box-containing protein
VDWQATPYTVAAAGAGLLVLALGALAWQRRPVPGATAFGLFAVAVADWCLAAAIAFAHTDLPGRILFSKFEYIGVSTAPPLWMLCMAACTGAAWRRRPWLLAGLAIVPLITLALVFSNEQHGLIWSRVELERDGGLIVWKATYGAWFWVHSAYSYIVLAGAALLILRQTRKDPYFFHSQGALLLIGMIVPWATNVVYLVLVLTTPFPHVDLTPIGFALGAVAVGAGLLRFGLFDVVPVAREVLVEGLPDAVVVLDLRDRVVEVNPAAERLLGQASRTLLSRPAKEIPSVEALLRAAAGEISASALHPRQPASTTDRQFEVGHFSLADSRQRPVGRLLLVRDITDRKSVEQERARAVREQMERVFSDEARQRYEFIAEATRQLTETLDVGATTAALASLMVPALAVWCSVDAVDGSNGPAQRFATPSDAEAGPSAGTLLRTLPLVAHGRTVGMLTWGAAPGPGFALIESTVADLAARAALAIDSAQLYAAERASRAAAEEAAARTTRLYEEQQRIVGRLLELRGKLEAVERAKLLDDERERIARELHDRVEQTFFSIGLSVNAVLTSMSAASMDSLRSALAVIRTSAQQGAEDLRAAIFPLSRTEVCDLELVQALWQLVREFQKRTGLEADLVESGEARRIPPEVAGVLHAVAREGLANVEQHARAAAVVVSLRFDPQALTLTVQDDGVGASALVLSTLADSATRFGLNGSHDRVERLGGTFTAEPGEDEGFVVRARVPLHVAVTPAGE